MPKQTVENEVLLCIADINANLPPEAATVIRISNAMNEPIRSTQVVISRLVKQGYVLECTPKRCSRTKTYSLTTLGSGRLIEITEQCETYYFADDIDSENMLSPYIPF